MLLKQFIRGTLSSVQRGAQLLGKFGSKPIGGTTQNVHSACSLGAKTFVDSENSFAHEVLVQSLRPYQLFRMESDQKNAAVASSELPAWVLDVTLLEPESLTGDDLYSTFCALRHYCTQHTETCISDARFSRFAQLYCAGTHKLTDAQLMDTLRQLALLPAVPSVKTPNFVELWNALDVECCRRLEGWKTDYMLLMCEAWYGLSLARICAFVTEALRKLGRKVRKMRPEQLVQTMFLVNVTRRPIYEMFDFEANLVLCAPSMTLSELGVMSLGFFKTQTPIRTPELLEHLYQRLMAEVDTVEDITLVALLKVLRYSSKLGQVHLVMQLLNRLSAQVERISIPSCLHVALLGSEMQCCNDEVMERILMRFNREIDQARLKDMERICFAITMFNLRFANRVEEELCAKIQQSLHSRVDEILRHPRCFSNLLHFLSLKGFYEKEMISSVLDPSYLRHAYGKNVMGREIFQLDSFVKINLQGEYEGSHLQDKYRRSMGKVLTHYIPERNPKYKLNNTDRILMEIKETADTMLRTNAFKHILPHFERPDVVICYDSEQRRAIPLSPECPENYSGVILTRSQLLGEASADSAHIDTVAIVVAGWNNCVRGLNRYTGLFEMKLKQLGLLGHKCIVISWHEWRDLETKADRQTFLKRQLSKVIKL